MAFPFVLFGGARVPARASSCRRDFTAEKRKFNLTDGMALPHIRGLPIRFRHPRCACASLRIPPDEIAELAALAERCVIAIATCLVQMPFRHQPAQFGRQALRNCHDVFRRSFIERVLDRLSVLDR
jgi:hypothetical protein